jgi:hypothetical protein
LKKIIEDIETATYFDITKFCTLRIVAQSNSICLQNQRILSSYEKRSIQGSIVFLRAQKGFV